MINKVVVAGLATTVIAGTAITLAGPAQAAAVKPCALGSWTMTGEKTNESGVYKGMPWRRAVRGADGIRLTLAQSTASYDFNGSKRETVTGVDGKTRVAYWSQYQGTLNADIKLSGDRKGTFALSGRTASGNATAHTVLTKPKHKDLGLSDVVANLRKGYFDTLMPYQAAFTCSSSTLKLTFKTSGRNKHASWNHASTLTYRRI